MPSKEFPAFQLETNINYDFNYNEYLKILLMLHEGAIFTFIILELKKSSFSYAPCVSINQRRGEEEKKATKYSWTTLGCDGAVFLAVIRNCSPSCSLLREHCSCLKCLRWEFLRLNANGLISSPGLSPCSMTSLSPANDETRWLWLVKQFNENNLQDQQNIQDVDCTCKVETKYSKKETFQRLFIFIGSKRKAVMVIRICEIEWEVFVKPGGWNNCWEII